MDDPALNVGGVDLIPASELTCEPVRWLWQGWLAGGKLHLLVGAPSAGKTTIAMAIAAAISAGGALPTGELAPEGKVVVWSGEDDYADTLLPRLRAMGLKDDQILFVDGRRDRRGRRRHFDPASDMDALRAKIKQVGDVAMLILDPIVGAVTGDSHRNTEVRRGLQPVVDLAEETGIAVLGITHMAKGTAGRDPTERVIGSIAFAAVARVVMIAGHGEEGGLLVMAKNNLAPAEGGIRYSLEAADVNGVKTVKVKWGDRVSGSARELLKAQEDDKEIGQTALDSACEWLDALLQDGPVLSKQVKDAAEEAGIAWRTLNRAKKILKVTSEKTPSGGWAWKQAKDAKAAKNP